MSRPVTPDLHRPVERELTVSLEEADHLGHRAGELMNHRLHVGSVGQHGIAVGREPQGGGLDIEEDILGPTPDVRGVGGRQTIGTAQVLELREIDGGRAVPGQDLLDQVGPGLGDDVGEHIIVRRGDVP